MSLYIPGGFNRIKMDKAGNEGGSGGGSTDPAPGAKPDPDPGESDPGDPNAKKTQDDPAPSGEDDSNWDEKTKSYIQGLRKENAKYRTSAKDTADDVATLKADNAKRDKMMKAALGIEDEDETTIEQKLEASQSDTATLQFKNEVLTLAVENGIGGDQAEYFEFLLGKAVNSLDEGDEITDEDIASIVEKVKGASGSANAGNTSTSVKGDTGGKQDPNPSVGGDNIGVQDFADMSFTDKGKLFGKNPDLYKKLNAEAVAKGLI